MTPDSTKDLLNANHMAVLRELTQVRDDLKTDLRGIKNDVSSLHEALDDHSLSDERRFGTIENRLGVLGWAYGAGVVILGAIWTLFKMGKLD